MKNDVIELEFNSNEKITNEAQEIGEVRREKYYESIFAERLNISQTEFYQAAASGLKPVLKFKINAFEYQGNERIRYNGKIYKIMRIYQTNVEDIEITCEGDIYGTS